MSLSADYKDVSADYKDYKGFQDVQKMRFQRYKEKVHSCHKSKCLAGSL